MSVTLGALAFDPSADYGSDNAELRFTARSLVSSNCNLKFNGLSLVDSSFYGFEAFRDIIGNNSAGRCF